MRRTVTEAQKRLVAASQGWRCAHCDQLLGAAFEVDHRQPLWDGGTDDIENLQALDASCHAAKTQAEAIERARRRRVRLAHGVRFPLSCLGCGAVTSPYFQHRCAP